MQCDKCGSKLVRDLYPKGDGTYRCVYCIKNDGPDFLYWD